jgi:hypothetical protein
MDLDNTLHTLLFKQGRSIAGIVPDVVIEEKHADTLTITDHPVEQGAAISDHAFKNPAELTMTCGFSGGGSLVDGLSFLPSIGKTPAEIYQQLLELQESRKPFDVVTGKRSYTNMLFRALSVRTDAKTCNVLMVEATLRQVIIVQTQAVSLPPADVQAQPQKTAATANTGVKQPVEQKESLLSRGAGLFGFGG